MKRALVTGSSGFVGAAMVRRLIADGWAVWGVDTGPRAIYDGGHVQTDCREFFTTALSYDQKFDLVLHCAGIVGGRAKIDGQPLAIADNLSIDAAAFQWAIKAQPKHFVYFSSSAAYPIRMQRHGWHVDELCERDIKLDNPEEADSIYGLAKLVGEHLAAEARVAGVNVHIFRPFSGTGVGQTLDYPVPAICHRAARGENPITIWSNSVRDIIHIDDIVNAVLVAVEANIPGPVNLCTGRPTTFAEVAEMAAHAAGYTGLVQVANDMPTGVHYRVGDPALLHTFYKPVVTVEEIVAQFVRHYQG